MNIISTIFKAYDIRGIVGKELNNDLIYSIGSIFGIHALKKKNIHLCDWKRW
jgi:phosphomannomutase